MPTETSPTATVLEDTLSFLKPTFDAINRAQAETPAPPTTPQVDAGKKEDTNVSAPTPNSQRPANPVADGTPAADASGTGKVAVPDPAAKPVDTGTKPAETPAKAPETKPEAEQPKPPVPGEDRELWPRSKEDWAKFKAKRAEKEAGFQKQIEELNAKVAERDKLAKELADLRSKQGEIPTDLKSELEAARKQAKEFSDKLAVLDVVNHPGFKAHYDGAVAKQVAIAARFVGQEKANKLAQIVAMPPGELQTSELDAFNAELSPWQNGTIGSVIAKLQEIEIDKAADIAMAGTKREAMLKEQAARQAAQAEEQKQNYAKTWSQLLSELSDATTGNPLFQTRADNAEWNNAVKADIDGASKELQEMASGKVDPKAFMERILVAKAYPRLLKHYQIDVQAAEARAAELQAENEKLAEQVKTLSAAQPAPTGDTTTGSSGADGAFKFDANAKPSDVAEQTARMFRGNWQG